MTVEIARKILQANRGANFIKADLHIHTPGSLEWDKKNTDPVFHSTSVKPEHIVQAAIDKGLGLIGITDHNSVEWCEPVIQAAKGTSLVVVPGFELTVRPGVHVLGLFEPNEVGIVDKMRDLLIKLGIEKGKIGHADGITEKTIEDLEFPIIRAIQNMNGIAIPAHIQSSSGLFGRIKGGQAANDFLEKSGCGILESNLSILPDRIKTLLRKNPNRFAIIENSDAHQLQQIGCNNLWLKMDDVGLNGLRQISLEPLKRIRYTGDDAKPKTKILGLYTNGGLLKDQVIAFNSELNCLIGGRGAGKSVVVDYLRFVFDSIPVDEDLKGKLFYRFVDLIRNSTSVYVLVEDREGKLWLYERTMKFDKKRKGSRENIDLQASPAVVYQIIQTPLQAIRINDNLPHHKFEFYGQGEVQSITETAEPSRQLKLIDDYIQININPKNKNCDAFIDELRNLESLIIKLDDEIEELETNISKLPDIETRISEIEADLIKNNLTDYQVWEDANQYVNEALNHLSQQKTALSEMRFQEYQSRDYTLPSSGAKSIFDNLVNGIQDALKTLTTTESELKKQFEEKYLNIGKIKKDWERVFNAEKEIFTETLRKQGFENLGALNSELADIKRIKEHVINNDIPRLAAAKVERNKENTKRGKQLEKLLRTWDDIRQARVTAAKRMTHKLGKSVIVEIQPQKNLDEYYTILYECAPSVIHSKNEQVQKIVENLNPKELVKAIRERKIEFIRERTNITQKTSELLLSIGEKELMQLERTRCNDIACVYLLLERRKKPLSDLSQGEKCTAILSVILLDEHSPLIIDQPEDELDHNFIMTSVVSTLGSVKQRCNPLNTGFVPKSGRQFIIATHNQNIPVLGDAELIIKMHKVLGEERCESESSHGLEHPNTIKHILNLEGGIEAFERRRRKYELSIC